MWQTALALLLLAAEPTPGEGFRWLDPGSDAPLVRKVERAFRNELKPDDPVEAEARHEVAVLYRYVDRVAVAGRHALVLIGNRDAPDDLEGTWFDPWNYDLETGRKEPIRTEDALFQWRFRGLASFEPAAVPDVVFQYFRGSSCTPTSTGTP